jgi:hypothetical protein
MIGMVICFLSVFGCGHKKTGMDAGDECACGLMGHYAAICGAGVGGESATRHNAASSRRLVSWVIGVFSALALK